MGSYAPKIDLELVNSSENGSFRWFHHDFPHPLAHWHFHPEFEIHLLTKGHGRAYVGDYIGPFKAGTLMMVGPNLPHNWVSDLDAGEHQFGRDCLIQFSMPLIDKAENLFQEISSIKPLLHQSRQGLEFFGETAKLGGELLISMQNTHGITRLIRFLELLELLSNSDEKQELASIEFISGVRLDDVARINAVIQYLYTHYPDPIRLGDLANKHHMCESSFSRFFKKNTGRNFVQYLSWLRINQAGILIINGASSISQVCYEVGFNNLANFNRSFLKQKKMTPTEFREKYGEGIKRQISK